jgi:excisionase family DNA binding protein
MTASDSKSLARRVAKTKAIDSDRPLTLMEAAARLRVGRSTMQKLVRERKIRFFKIGRALRIRIDSIDEFIAKLEKRAKL